MQIVNEMILMQMVNISQLICCCIFWKLVNKQTKKYKEDKYVYKCNTCINPIPFQCDRVIVCLVYIHPDFLTAVSMLMLSRSAKSNQYSVIDNK